MNGWKLVPVEPTDEMLATSHATNNPHVLALNANIYKAMLAAAPEPSASVGMEPVATVCGSRVNWIQPQAGKLRDRCALYSADQLATLQAKLEQAEKDKAELVAAIRRVVYLSDRDHDAWNAAKETLAKYEEKKS